MTSHTKSALAYDIRKAPVGSGRHTVARLWCVDCGDTIDISMPRVGHSPESMAKRFTKEGWEIDLYNKRRCYCPKHKNQKRRVDPEALIKKLPALRTPAAPMEVKMATTIAGTPGILGVAAGEPTTADKGRIRQLLDKHFDDSKGMYIDGYTDQRIGQELNLPWGAVAKVREAAYGPLKQDPEVASIKSEISRITSQLNTLSSDITALRTRVMAVEKRFSV